MSDNGEFNLSIEKKRSIIINFVYYLLLIAVFAVLLKFALPMLTPFVLGFCVAYILRKPTRYVAKKLKIGYKPVALVMVLLFYATIGLVIALLVIRTIGGLQSLATFAVSLYNNDVAPLLGTSFSNVENAILQIDPRLFEYVGGFSDQIMQTIGKAVSSLSSWIVSTASDLAASIPGLFVAVVLMIISSFFIAADYSKLVGFCLRQLNDKSVALFHEIHQYVVGTLFVCIRSYFIIMSLTFVELSIGLSIIGIQHAVLIAALIAIFDILPVLGTGGIMIPWSVISLLGGDLSTALVLLLVYIAITVIRNIVEPKIVGGQLGLHPVVTLASMYLGVQLLGVIGLFGFPILLSLLRHLNDNGFIHLFK